MAPAFQMQARQIGHPPHTTDPNTRSGFSWRHMYRSPPPIREIDLRCTIQSKSKPSGNSVSDSAMGTTSKSCSTGQDLPARPHLHCLLVESWRHIKRGDQANSGASQPANRKTDRITSYSKNRSCVGSKYGITLCSSTLLTATRPRVSSRPAPSI